MDRAVLALDTLGMTAAGPFQRCVTLPDRARRQVLRATVLSGRGREDVAVKVLLDPAAGDRAAFSHEHAVARVLHAVADTLVDSGVLSRNPIVQVLHPDPIGVEGALVAVTRFVPDCGRPVTARQWGQTLGMLHVIGSTDAALTLLANHRATNVLFGLDADTLLAALGQPGHPFGDDHALVLKFARQLRERALRAVDFDPHPLLAHHDFHALNCINATTGAVAIDWQDAGWGNRSDDFAWLHLAVRRFGRPATLLDEATRAYASITGGVRPSAEQIEASGQVLELLCLGFSLKNAGRNSTYLQECWNELPILGDPNAVTGRWRMLSNPTIFSPGVVTAHAGG